MSYLILIIFSLVLWFVMWAFEQHETRQDARAESTAYWLRRDGRKGFEE